MDKFIEAIINADKEAREQVENAKAYHTSIQKEASTNRNEIYDQFMKKEELIIEARKKEMHDALDNQSNDSIQTYESSLISLQSLYEENKDQWVSHIVDRCLHE